MHSILDAPSFNATVLPECNPSRFLRSCRPLFLAQFDGICIACRFDARHYHRDLFKYFGVSFSSSLVHATPQRRAAYLAGRFAAQRAMRYLNHPVADVPPSTDHAPRWPEGVTASISHSGELAICAMTRRSAPVGINLEKIMDSTAAREIENHVLAPVDQQRVVRQFSDYNLGLTLAYSAKKTLYKAMQPALQMPFDFLDLDLLAADERQQWLGFTPGTALQSSLPSGSHFSIRWIRLGPYVLSYSARDFVKNNTAIYRSTPSDDELD